MKKFLLLLLALILCLSMVACGDKKDKKDKDDDDSSTSVSVSDAKYHLYSMESPGESYDNATVVANGLDVCYIELKADGTFTMDMGGDVTNGTYDATTMTADGVSNNYTISGNTLTLDDGEGTIITFKK